MLLRTYNIILHLLGSETHNYFTAERMHSVCSGFALRKPSCNLQKLYYIQRKSFARFINVCPTYTYLWYIWDCGRYLWTEQGKLKNLLLISFLFKILILAFQHISNNLEFVKWKVKGAFYLACNKVKPN